MTRLIVASLIATSTLFGAFGASAQTARDLPPLGVASPAPAAFVARRCGGVACLQGIPSVGVGF